MQSLAIVRTMFGVLCAFLLVLTCGDAAAREYLRADRYLYVGPQPCSDSASGLSERERLCSIQVALDRIVFGLDLGGRTACVLLADGTYQAPVGVPVILAGSTPPGLRSTMSLCIRGNDANPERVTLIGRDAPAVQVGDSVGSRGSLRLTGVRLVTQGRPYSGSGIETHAGSAISIANIDWGDLTGWGIWTHTGGFLRTDACAPQCALYRVSGNSRGFIFATANAVLSFHYNKITFSGNPFIDRLIYVGNNASVVFDGNKFEGAFRTYQKCLVENGGTLNTGTPDQNYIPGGGSCDAGIGGVIR